MRKWNIVVLAIAAGLFLTGCKKEAVKEGLEPVPQEMVVSEPPQEAAPEAVKPPAPQQPSATTVAPRIYVVQKGDTLYSIARKIYNDQTKWKAIYQANKDRISDPDVLKVGQKLILP